MATTYNAAVAGIISQLAASPSLAGVSVFDGQPMISETLEWIAVGYQPETTEVATFDWTWAQLGAQRSEERYEILCSLASWSGDTLMSDRRLRAIALRDAVAAALTTDRTLGGAVRLAHMSAGTLRQEQDASGSVAGFEFTIAIEARINT